MSGYKGGAVPVKRLSGQAQVTAKGLL
jgi:hypothetical protein